LDHVELVFVGGGLFIDQQLFQQFGGLLLQLDFGRVDFHHLFNLGWIQHLLDLQHLLCVLDHAVHLQGEVVLDAKVESSDLGLALGLGERLFDVFYFVSDLREKIVIVGDYLILLLGFFLRLFLFSGSLAGLVVHRMAVIILLRLRFTLFNAVIVQLEVAAILFMQLLVALVLVLLLVVVLHVAVEVVVVVVCVTVEVTFALPVFLLGGHEFEVLEPVFEEVVLQVVGATVFSAVVVVVVAFIRVRVGGFEGFIGGHHLVDLVQQVAVVGVRLALGLELLLFVRVEVRYVLGVRVSSENVLFDVSVGKWVVILVINLLVVREVFIVGTYIFIFFGILV